MLDQLATLRARKCIGGIERNFRIAILKIFEDRLRFRQIPFLGLKVGDFAHRRLGYKAVALPRVNDPLLERDALLKQYELEFVIVIADAKAVQGYHGSAPAILEECHLHQ